MKLRLTLGMLVISMFKRLRQVNCHGFKDSGACRMRPCLKHTHAGKGQAKKEGERHRGRR